MSMRTPDRHATRLSTLTLLGLVLLGFVAIIGFSSVFQTLIDRLDQQLENRRAQLFVGEQILTTIGNLERLFLQLSQSSHEAMHEQIGRNIASHTAQLSAYMTVLERGGTARRQLPLNLPGVDEMLREVRYTPDTGQAGPPMEVVELTPYLERLEGKFAEIHALIDARERCSTQRLPCQASALEAVETFYKTSASFFYRLNENANRQFFNAVQSMDRLELRLHQEELKLRAVQLALICAVAGLVLGLSVLFTRRINLAISAMEQARQHADEANAAKSRFLASMSHEIRTPMNAVLGMAQVLEKGNLGAGQQQQCVRLILDSGRELLGLLNEILDLAKVESGQLVLRPRSESPVRLARDTLATYREMAESRGLALSLQASLGADRPYLIDATRFKQILGNLVSNAIKFTPAGSITIQISLVAEEAEDQPGSLLEVAVSDTGIGIAPEQIGQLFESFRQVDNSLTRQHAGTGLGLSIVRQLAELMDGSAGVTSSLGAGSRFWVRLRLAPDESPQAQDVALPHAVAEGRLKGHVLVAEDLTENVATITAMLSSMGITSTVVSDGRKAVNAVDAGGQFDCILMDMNMPVMGGIEATLAIRRLEASGREGRMARCPIIGVTANAYPEDRERCITAGMDAFVAKPVEMASLHAELSRYLPAGEAHALDPTASTPSTGTPGATAAALEPGRLDVLLDELQQLLAEHMFGAMEKYEELQALLRESHVRAGLAPVGEQLQQMNFQAAGALLRQWRSQHGFNT